MKTAIRNFGQWRFILQLGVLLLAIHPAIGQTDPKPELDDDETLSPELQRKKELRAMAKAVEEAHEQSWEMRDKLAEAKKQLAEAMDLESEIAEQCLEALSRGIKDDSLATKWQEARTKTAEAQEAYFKASQLLAASQVQELDLAKRLAFENAELEFLIPREASAPPDMAPGDRQCSVIEIHYGTDRNSLERVKLVQTYGHESVGLSLGVCHVSIPMNHKPGCMEAPSWWQSPDPTRHILVLDAFKLSEEGFTNSIRSAVTRSGDKELLVFVHGYNVGFDESARRCAQLTYDLGFKGVTAMYSWPSFGKTDAYGADLDMAMFHSGRHLASFLKLLVKQSQATRIHIIAHSMGNLLLCRAMEELANGDNQSLHFNQIVMAAPDVPAKAFVDTYAALLAKRCDHVTIYASSKDLALEISENLRKGAPRLGATDTAVTIIDGMDTVVADEFDHGILYHSYYADVESILQDLIATIRMGYDPLKRCLVEERAQAGRFWKCIKKPNSVCRQSLVKAIQEFGTR